MPVTIRDVARQAGVSVKTVSRVINGDGPVREATRQRVQAVIEALHYRPNAVARSLVTRRTMALGLLIADVINPFFPEVVRGVEDAAKVAGYTVLLGNTDEDPVQEERYLALMQERQVDGLVLSGSRAEEEVLRQAADSGFWMALINRAVHHPRILSILVDNADATAQATSYLIQKGHRRIAYLLGPSRAEAARLRFEGYRRALREHGIPFRPAYVVQEIPRIEGGRKAMRTLLALPSPPTAVVAYNDLMAIGAIEAVQEAGGRVPDDVAVIGFDDILLAAYTIPPLTTVRVPKYEMGYKAAAALIDTIKIGRTSPRVVRFKGKIVVRGSA
ncbi:MAG: LacI family DNA-binding transcriptional regulator [Armatimonadota bacterium]|nr:LacI family DNA-binding transcriptional regulator [Armatimonadota bacterium]